MLSKIKKTIKLRHLAVLISGIVFFTILFILFLEKNDRQGLLTAPSENSLHSAEKKDQESEKKEGKPGEQASPVKSGIKQIIVFVLRLVPGGSLLNSYSGNSDDDTEDPLTYNPWINNKIRKQNNQSLSGRVVDQLGASVVGATVTLTGSNHEEKSTYTDEQGRYFFKNLAIGEYTIRVKSPGFVNFERKGINISSGDQEKFDVTLSVTIENQEVTVKSDKLLTVAPDNNLNSRVIKGKDLKNLPVGPGGLAATLKAMTVPSAGPQGAQILVDGFPSGQIPPKESIREIRINKNPFSAEYDKVGSNRIEILTEPGTEKFHGATFFDFNDESLNSRNPFAETRAPYQSRQFGADVSGPIIKNRVSYFINYERNAVDNNAVINATIVDPAFNIVPLNQSVVTPQRTQRLGARFDVKINEKNTLVARYNNSSSTSENEGIGGFSLPSRAYPVKNQEQVLQLTETVVLNNKAINETRLQFVDRENRSEAENSIPAVIVPDAFTGGANQQGNAFNNQRQFDLQNNTFLSVKDHSIKFGLQFRRVNIKDYAPDNFGGTFIFAGGLGPQLNYLNQVILGSDNQPLMAPISSIERYRRTLLFHAQGLSSSEIRNLGGGPAQYLLATGDPSARVKQKELGFYGQDDWQVKRNLTLSFGLRYETQNNLTKDHDFAPRFAFAWSPQKNDNPKTVVRGGIGLFYERFSENYVLQRNRFNGVNVKKFIVNDPSMLDFFGSNNNLQEMSSTTVSIAQKLRAPFTVQSSISIEQELPWGFTLGASFLNTQTQRALRSRNINAPLLGALTNGASQNASRPLGNVGEVFQYESTGRYKQKQFVLNLVKSAERLSFYGTYILNQAKSDTEGAEYYPVNTYDLSGEWGRSDLDSRHNFYFGGWLRGPWGLDFSTLLFARTGFPFNITTGRDTNRDTIYNERPAFATDLKRTSVVLTPAGAFDLDPQPGQQIVPRNYGNGPNFVSMNVGVSRTFDLESLFKKKNSSTSLTASLRVENLLNNTNPDKPIGNLSSPLFGKSNSSAGDYGLGSNPAGNRRVSFQVSFRF